MTTNSNASLRRLSAWLVLLVCGVALSVSRASAQSRVGEPPVTRTVDQVDELHGVRIEDPYRWLENESDPEVLRWVEKQNEYTRANLNGYAERAEIRKRLEQLRSATTSSSPTVVGDRYFFTRREKLQNHSVLYVREGSYKAEPKVLIDPNTFSQDGTVALDWRSISPSGALIAYGKSSSGDEKSTLYIKDVATGKHLPDVIPNTRYCAIAWAMDEKSFTYTRYPTPGTVPTGDENYYRKVYHHRLGDDWKNDKLVVGNLVTKEEMLGPYGNATHDWEFLTRSVDWSKNDLYFRRAGSDGPFKPIAVGLEAEVGADLVYGKLIIHTDYEAPRFRVMAADPKRPGPEHWKELIPQLKGVITGVKAVDHKLIVTVRENAHSRVFLYDMKGKRLGEIKLPTLGSIGGISGEWDDTEVFFGFSSYAYPPAHYRYDLRSGELELIDRMEIDINPDLYETTQEWFASKDGTKVPMFIIRKKGMKLDGSHPTVLYGYGGFNISMSPRFSPGLFVWLDRGGVYAIANLRGGGEFGREWHQSGRRGKKQNVFDDFIGAGEALIERGYTSRDKLAIYGGSNGGLLVGACMVQRPDLFRAVVCAVPLLDMIRYHNWSIARLWIPEYGSADDPEEFKWLYAYSPYHHVRRNVQYPATLFMTATSDSRVNPLHAWKMTALVQSQTSGDRPILLRTESKAGHGAGKPLSKRIDADVDRWVFLMSQLGMIHRTAGAPG